MEGVMAALATNFSARPGIEVTLIVLGGRDNFYQLPDAVKIITPDFDYKKYSRLRFTAKIFFYLHRTLRQLQPDVLLSFSEKYNAFVTLAALGKGVKIFLSDRASPLYSCGAIIDRLNPIVYRFADGIIAQTQMAKQRLQAKTKHKNIVVIGNPVRPFTPTIQHRQHIILNVGRFSDQKNQWLLAEHYAALPDKKDWVVKLVGDGLKEQITRSRVADLNLQDKILFEGAQKNTAPYYSSASIFAFTSLSEGFPNVLAEAMAAGLACISYDCVAGPADLIDDGVNGFLIPVGNHQLYVSRLQQMIDDDALRQQFGIKAKEKMKDYELNIIAQRFFDFLTASTNAVTH